MRSEKSNALKALESQQKKLFLDLLSLIEKPNFKPDDELRVLRTKLIKMGRQIRKLRVKPTDLIVSEHAILRYCERVKQMDIDAIVNDILTPQLVTAEKALGNGKFPSGTGFKVVVRNKVVVTVET